MNLQTVDAIRRAYRLGARTVDFSTATESQHSVWRLETDRGAFAVKKLNSTDSSWIGRYERTERIASRFADLGVQTVSAIPEQDKVVNEFDGALYVVYPWVEGVSGSSECSESRVREIAHLLADIHNVDLQDVEGEPQKPRLVDIDLLNGLVGDGETRRRVEDLARETNRNLQASSEDLEPTLLSHTDLNPDNVLWTQEGPCLLDWEQACEAYYSVDLMSTGLVWSGLHVGEFNEPLFGAFKETYQERYNLLSARRGRRFS